MQELSELQSEEEERSVVGHGRHIVGVMRSKIFRIVRADQLGKGAGAGSIMLLAPAGRGQSRTGWRIQQKQFGMNCHVFPHSAYFLRSERGALGQNDHRNSIRVEVS